MDKTAGGKAHEGSHVHGASSRRGGGEQPQANARRGGEGGREETTRGQVASLANRIITMCLLSVVFLAYDLRVQHLPRSTLT